MGGAGLVGPNFHGRSRTCSPGPRTGREGPSMFGLSLRHDRHGAVCTATAHHPKRMNRLARSLPGVLTSSG